ncbi:MAG: imm11 family protein [Neptuniibacter sp.]
MYWVSGSYSGSINVNDGSRVMPESLDAPPFFTGSKMQNAWVEPPLKLSQGEIYDVMSYRPGAIVISKSAKTEIEPFIKDEVEFLPITMGETIELYVINVINVIDCLNFERSEVRFHADGKTVRTVRHYDFNLKRLSGVNLFKIPETKSAEILCTPEFKKKLDGLSISGVKCVSVL